MGASPKRKKGKKGGSRGGGSGSGSGDAAGASGAAGAAAASGSGASIGGTAGAEGEAEEAWPALRCDICRRPRHVECLAPSQVKVWFMDLFTWSGQVDSCALGLPTV